MDKSTIRIQEIRISNFKNIENGIITFPSFKKGMYFENKSEIIGIYGQNGSGKTSVVEGMEIYKALSSGEQLKEDVFHFIQDNKSEMKIEVTFYIETNKSKVILFYEVLINRREEIVEKILLKNYIPEEDKWSKVKTVINSGKKLVRKYSRLEIERAIAMRNRKSSIFANEILKEIESNRTIYSDLVTSDVNDYINLLQTYGKSNLCIINHKEDGIITQNIQIPINIRHVDESNISYGKIVVSLDETDVIPSNKYKIFLDNIRKINIVLEKIIPGTNVLVKEYGKETNSKNEEEIRIELFSVKDSVKIPLRYESEGIKKIISILSTIMAVYNIPSYCLIIDELDSGIFEYLLGEVLTILSETGKGQLIFTSHNLRPLEVLSSEEIYFSTTNPKNKFIKFSGIKENSNLRNIFIRSITLGGQSEEIYKETDSSEISRAFRISGRE